MVTSQQRGEGKLAKRRQGREAALAPILAALKKLAAKYGEPQVRAAANRYSANTRARLRAERDIIEAEERIAALRKKFS